MRALKTAGLFFWIIFGLLSAELALGAVVSGQAYDSSYEPLPNTLLEVTTHPKQSYVSKDGSYEFTLTPGKYDISAYHRLGNGTVIFTSKEVLVSGSGSYIVDLVLDSVFTGQTPSETLPFHLKLVRGLQENYQLAIIAIVAVIGISILVILLRRNKPTKELDNSLDSVISIIKQSGGRITQKDLRKQMSNLSEAKISLMVSELEAKGHLEKIKKGRGNIIVLKRRG